MKTDPQRIIALLGPTNTGKTHVAIEKMLEYKTGIFGLPLRLLVLERFMINALTRLVLKELLS